MKNKVLIYCTKAKPYLYRNKAHKNSLMCLGRKLGNYYSNVCDYDYLNGKIVAECEVECEDLLCDTSKYTYCTKSLSVSEFRVKSCLGSEQLLTYLGNGQDKKFIFCTTLKVVGYALHISNLKVFDRPMELYEVHQNIKEEPPQELLCPECGKPMEYYKYKYLTNAPQNMMWVWYKGERYCLISIRPEWVAKILNGEKTIEVRKKVLKEMI